MYSRFEAALGVIAALILNWVITEVAKTKRGAKMKYGAIGLTLILLPNAVSWIVFPRVRLYFAVLFVAAALGAVILIWDLTSKRPS